MAFSDDDLPPEPSKEVKRRIRYSRKKKELDELLSVATRGAHVARDKGYYKVSPEAIECVQALRKIRNLKLNHQLIKETNALRTLRFLSTNGNPKIRSESRSSVDHLIGILHNKAKE